MSLVVALLLILPAAAALACLRAPVSAAPGVTVSTAVACLVLVIVLVPPAADHDLAYLGFLRVDAVSVVFLLATSFLYAVVAVYSVGYLKHGPGGAGSARYNRRFWVGLNVFAWAMLAAPLMGNLALLWVAVEITTVVSALLVAIENTDGSAEAAWKYLLIASAGLGLSLLATIFAYYSGAQVLGQSYDLGFTALLGSAGHLPHAPVELAFVLAVLGYGTKMGLVPVHTWLPDAHSEAPTPVSALLSGSLLAVSFYAILRFYQVTATAVGPHFPRSVLLIFGIASLLLAGLYLFGQRDIKRLLAYSSVEHMGILAIGVSFGAPIALAGVMLHVLAHAAAKGSAFMGAGVLVRKFGTKQISAIRGGLDALPWSGPLFLLAVLALGAMPPSGIFRSEFQIVQGGFASSGNTAAAILIVGVTLAFLGLATAATQMLFAPAARPSGPRRVLVPAVAGGQDDSALADGAGATGPGQIAHEPITRGEPSTWMVVPLVAGAVALIVLGVHPPAELTDLIGRAAHVLSGAAS